MTIPRYQALHRHWRRHPRPEWLVAGYLGYRPPPDMSSQGAMMRGRGHSSSATPHGQPEASAVTRRGAIAPPTGELLTLFKSLGGQPGKTVVLAA